MKKPEILRLVRKKGPKRRERGRKSKAVWKLNEAHLTEREYLD